jgi:hypothetical protein
MADLICLHVFGLKKFTWGQSSLVEPSTQRAAYLKALKLADKGDYKELMKFARS